MEWLEIATQNGLGFASFVALKEISKTLIQLVDRVDNIEDKLAIKEK